jgi:hypothetical protein
MEEAAARTFDEPEVAEELIAALRINGNAILLIDSDRRKVDDPLKVHTQRLIDELSGKRGLAWVTAGKEVENYIPPAVFPLLHNDATLKGPAVFSDVLEYNRDKYGNANPLPKTELARRVIPHLRREMLASHSDLAEKLDVVCERIRKWNGMFAEPASEPTTETTAASA